MQAWRNNEAAIPHFREIAGHDPLSVAAGRIMTGQEHRRPDQSALQGSAASRNPSPRKLKARTGTTTGTPGNMSQG